MMNRGQRRLSTVILTAVIFLSFPCLVPVSWGQDEPAIREDPQTPPLETSLESSPAESMPEPIEESQPPVEDTPGATEEQPIVVDVLGEAPADVEEESAPALEVLTVPSSMPEARPGEYIVQEGDTLWDISTALLLDSFLWPNLWRHNDYIINPDLIFPGNIIKLPGQRMEEVAEEPERVVMTPLEPTTPEPAVEEPVPLEVEPEIEPPIEVVTPEPTAPEPVPLDLGFLPPTGYILTGQQSLGTVVGARDNREIIGEGETAYILPKKGSNPQVGDRFTLYRPVRKVYHPKTRKYMGDLIRILGITEIIGVNPKEKTITSKIQVSYDYIQKGDFLMPLQLSEPPLGPETTVESASNGVKGYIVEVKEDRASHSEFDVVYLDRGRQDGILEGDRFSIVREGEKTSFFSPGRGVRLPRRVIGQLQVIAVQDITATARVLKSTEVIFKGDRFEGLPTP